MSCSSCYGCTNCYPCTTCGAAAPPPPPPPDCPNPVQCEEVINSKCVVYDGVDLPNLGVEPSEDGPITVNDIFYYIDQSIYNAGIGTVNITSNSDCLTVSGSGTTGDPIVLDLNLGTGLTCGTTGIEIDPTSLQNIDVLQYSGQAWTDPTTKTELTTKYDTQQTGTSVALQIVGGGSVPPLNAVDWKTKTLVEALDYILFPSRDASYASPLVTLTLSTTVKKGMAPTTAYYEAGSKLKMTFTPGAENRDAGGLYKLQIFNSPSTQLCTDQVPPFTTTGPATTTEVIQIPYAVYKPDGTNAVSTETDIYNKIVKYTYSGTTCTPPDIETDVNLILPKPSTSQKTVDISWFAKGFFKDGPIKKNINANTFNTAQQIKDIPAGRNSSTITYTSVYPVYYGIINGDTANGGVPLATVTAAYIAARITQCSSDSGSFEATNIKTKKKLIDATGNVSINYAQDFNSSNQIQNHHHWIAIPKGFPEKAQVFLEWISATSGSTITTPSSGNANAWFNLGDVVDIPQASSNPLWTTTYTIYRTVGSTDSDNNNTTFKNS